MYSGLYWIVSKLLRPHIHTYYSCSNSCCIKWPVWLCQLLKTTSSNNCTIWWVYCCLMRLLMVPQTEQGSTYLCLEGEIHAIIFENGGKLTEWWSMRFDKFFYLFMYHKERILFVFLDSGNCILCTALYMVTVVWVSVKYTIILRKWCSSQFWTLVFVNCFKSVHNKLWWHRHVSVVPLSSCQGVCQT